MALLGRLAGMFGSDVRARGREYQRGGAGKISRHDHNSLRASVQGTRPYRVDISWPEGDFDFQCTCPYSAEYGDPCKHIWATLLEADERGLLPGRTTGATAAGNGDDPEVVDIDDEDEGTESAANEVDDSEGDD